MKFEKFEIAEGDEVDPSEEYLATMSAEGARAIFYALLAYRDQLVDDIATQFRGRNNPRPPGNYGLEDDKFLAETLAQVTALAYAMTENDVDMNFSRGAAPMYRKMTREELKDEKRYSGELVDPASFTHITNMNTGEVTKLGPER